jgi:hypothetical protein
MGGEICSALEIIFGGPWASPAVDLLLVFKRKFFFSRAEQITA